MPQRSTYAPLDVACPLCRARPGARCVSVVIASRPYLRRPHADRVTAARMAEERRQHPRPPSYVSDAWTCPACGRSYWPPAEWEPEVWLAAKRAAQLEHGARHQQERADAASHGRPL